MINRVELYVLEVLPPLQAYPAHPLEIATV